MSWRRDYRTQMPQLRILKLNSMKDIMYLYINVLKSMRKDLMLSVERNIIRIRILLSDNASNLMSPI